MPTVRHQNNETKPIVGGGTMTEGDIQSRQVANLDGFPAGQPLSAD